MLGGTPRIMPQQYNDPMRGGEAQVRLHVHTLQEGQEVLIARRTRELLGA